MSSRLTHSSSFTKFIIVFEFILVAYLLYSLTTNVYNSYKIDKYIETFRQENFQIENENKERTEDYLYFTSNEYIDKIAKQNLGLVNPGEEVIILSPGALEVDLSLSEDELPVFAKYSGMTVSEQWWFFFFGD